MTTARSASTLGKKIFFLSGSSTITYGIYKSKTDPLHVVWDLDHTLICSVSPLPSASSSTANMSLRYFDQIDDDFPYQDNMPNTRTYIRPGAMTALWFTGLFATNHVYTAAQETYTRNILEEIDPQRIIFQTVIHRDLVPHHDHSSTFVKFIGKDLRLTLAQHSQQQQNIKNDNMVNGNNIKDTTATPDINLATTMCTKRILLFDDRIRNFTPQPKNGIHVQPYQVQDRELENSKKYLNEWKEMTRLCFAAVLCLYSSDVRSVLQYSCFRSNEHHAKFPLSK